MWEVLRPSYQNLLRNAPMISVRKRGVVVWNLEAHKALGWPEWVLLQFDRERSLLGLHPADRDGEEVFVVRKAGKANLWRIGATRALRSAGLLETVQRGVARERDGVLSIVVMADGKGE